MSSRNFAGPLGLNMAETWDNSIDQGAIDMILTCVVHTLVGSGAVTRRIHA
jgi:hypothetical protein